MTRRKLGFVLALLCAMLSSFTLAYATSDGDTIYLGPAPAEEEIKLDIQEETLPETAAAVVEIIPICCRTARFWWTMPDCYPHRRNRRS